jgi:hypothetical protein
LGFLLFGGFGGFYGHGARFHCAGLPGRGGGVVCGDEQRQTDKHYKKQVSQHAISEVYAEKLWQAQGLACSIPADYVSCDILECLTNFDIIYRYFQIKQDIFYLPVMWHKD